MRFNFRERFTFRHKGLKLGFSWFFQKILSSDFLGLILNKVLAILIVNPVLKDFVFKVRSKMFFTDLITGFAKIKY